ncbi:hypothetical protein FSC37_14050 [Piscinibacter aquaticus]|uniref:CheW-like domain-containing protein n=1 Tax=Piscinibacter aquaticus TaxID=392597 RepID=A0A5C6U715_9BURK|nr:hypothetical protein FSC37_14050 [Piscinibacter aquaticus]
MRNAKVGSSTLFTGTRRARPGIRRDPGPFRFPSPPATAHQGLRRPAVCVTSHSKAPSAVCRQRPSPLLYRRTSYHFHHYSLRAGSAGGRAGPWPGAAVRRATPHDDGSGSVITSRLPVEKAVPKERAVKILPYGEREALFGPDHRLRRIRGLRGRSLPVDCLARLTGGKVDRITDAAAVLVVDGGDGLVGFGVPQLRSIERAHWRHDLPIAGGGRPEMVTVGEPAARRTLELLDLVARAGRLRAEALAASA